MKHTDHTASHVTDLVDSYTDERWSLYRCGTCFALVLSEDAADHGQWHADQETAWAAGYGRGRDDEAQGLPLAAEGAS